MKILHITTHLNIGGVGSYLLMSSSRLVRMGHTVSVVSAGGEMEDRFRAKKIGVLTLPIRTKNEFHPKVFAALPQLIRFIRSEGIEVLHAHSRVGQTLAHWASVFTKVPYMTTAHGYYKPRLSRRWFPMWGKRVIAVSSLVADELKKSHKISNDRIRVIPNAVDIGDLEERLGKQEAYRVRMEFGIPQDAFVLGCIARLVRDKGQEVLIAAAKELKKDVPNIYVLIAGDGRERSRYEKLIQKCGLQQNAQVLASQADISELLTAMDVLVHPATFREGFGLTLVEAMVAKKPIIASDIWAINTVIRNRVNGFLVEPKDPKALAREVRFVMQNPEMAKSIAENGYWIANELYSIDRMASEMETVYQEMGRVKV